MSPPFHAEPQLAGEDTDEHEFLTIAQVARRLEVHWQTVKLWVDRGIVPFKLKRTLINRRPLIDWTMLQVLIDETKEKRHRWGPRFAPNKKKYHPDRCAICQKHKADSTGICSHCKGGKTISETPFGRGARKARAL